MSFYDHEIIKNSGEKVALSAFKGKVLLIVNTASKCGFTPQYDGLEKLYSSFKDSGVEVLAFPCDQFGNQEPGSNEEIAEFCTMNFGVTFPVFEKVEVNGHNAHPLFNELKDKAPGLLGSKRIKWNFTKFLVNKDGTKVNRYAPTTKPADIQRDIEAFLAE